MAGLGRIGLAVLGLIFALLSAVRAEEPALRIALLKTGTVNWEVDVIRHHGLDRANGFRLEVLEMAGNPAAQIAFQGGEADVIVSDWIWVARQRAAGRDFVFLPYSKAVGGLMVPAASPVGKLADLRGQKVAIAGGPLDKSWLILRAYAARTEGFDLASETEQVFGAPPLVFQQAKAGEVAAAINFWHFMAKMRAAGMRDLISVAAAAQALGLDPETPLLGYVLSGALLRDKPELVRGLADASRQAKALLATSDEEWARIRPLMNAGSDAEFAALVAGYREGIPSGAPVDEAAAAKLLALMAELGGEELVGTATTLPEGVFVQPGS
ncbi:MAG TPA: ABC transporter substrate-binding protein [Paracoccaceae bacterium]|nr:ABC transporter substrate-binding protein [Paracoccaceae bacterium]